MNGFDVIVVGAGVVRMATALSAAKAGLTVGLIGPCFAIPGAASPAAGAMLGVLGEHTDGLRFRHRAAARWPDWLAGITERAPPPVTLQ